MSDDKKSVIQSIVNGVKWLFFEDEDESVRFEDEKSVLEFLALDEFAGDSNAGKLVKRWFFITNRKDLMSTSKVTKERYDEMVGHFNLFVDALFVHRYTQEEKENKVKSEAYTTEFEKLLESFEQFVYNEVANKIDSDRPKRKKIQVQLDNE